MESRPLSRWMTLAAIVALSACAVSASSGSSAQPTAVISQASGTFSITNSRDGQAIFQAQGLAPGRSVNGTVQLSNAGTLAGDLGLQQLDVVDHPGANGGRLSDAVQLDVHDITGGNLVPVFAGQLASLQSSALGALAPGEARTYRFTASLPDGGAPSSPTSGDNSYAGSALTVRYSWHASAPDPGEGGGGSTGGGGTSPSGNNPPGPTAPRTVRPKATFRINSKKLLKRGWLDVLVSCNRACGVVASAQSLKPPRGRRPVKLSRRRAALTLPAKVARIRLKLTTRARRQLHTALRTRGRVSIRVSLSVVPVAWTKTLHYSKKVVVKRPKKKRR
jgi:spore coat-associated protein N